jgi:large subunit ribosomal protein L15
MQLHELKPKNKKKKKKRIGRGGKRGTYSGRGIKGQKARAGSSRKPIIRELIKKYPKLRGYKFNSYNPDYAVINILDIDEKFKDKEKITPKILLERGLIRKIKGKTPKVKILAKGDTKKSFVFEGCDFSQKAQEKIEKANGEIK